MVIFTTFHVKLATRAPPVTITGKCPARLPVALGTRSTPVLIVVCLLRSSAAWLFVVRFSSYVCRPFYCDIVCFNGEMSSQADCPRLPSKGMCCSVPGCSLRSGTNLLSTVKMYRFPADHKRRASRLQAMKRDKWQPNNNSRICSVHFLQGEL